MTAFKEAVLRSQKMKLELVIATATNQLAKIDQQLKGGLS